jgi:AraC family L-rhamnose operon transcriptional activator RhaR
MGESRSDLVTLDWQSLRDGNACGLLVRRLPDHEATGPHDHVFHEIVYVESGTSEHHAADGRRMLRPGDVIVLRPQVWHAYASPRKLTIINCLIDGPLMSRLGPLLGSTDGVFDLLRRRTRRPGEAAPVVLHASTAQRSAVLQRLETMLAEQRERRSGWEAAAAAALLDLLVLLARMHVGPVDEARPRLADRTEQGVLDAASYIETHFAQPLRLDQLARQVGLSPAHLSRSFGRRMGMGTVSYLHRARAEEACRLLRYTDQRVGHIAARVGYDEIAYFSRCFRAQIGVSPRTYRDSWHAP